MSTGTRPQNTPSAEADAPQLDLSGRTIGDFHVLRKLGQGGMGQVYLAEQVSLKRKVALKILRPEMTSPQALARFKLEAEAVARVTHANIVQVYAFGEAEGMPYMALEYVEGRNLKEYISKKGPPDLLVSLSIMRQVASALQRASELGIIHRDIKPENILLTRKGEVKVADFGLSRCLVEEGKPAVNLTQTGVTMGTPLYMSPEQVEGKPVDPRTDIYSFGVTCFFMFTGQPPFTGSTAFEVALQHVQKPPPALRKIRPDLPEVLCAVVQKMMAKDPAQRYQTGRDLLRDLSRLREGLSGTTAAMGQAALSIETTSALSRTSTAPGDQTLTAAEMPALTSRRNWVFLGMGLTLLLAVGAGAALAWRERRREGPMPGSAGVKAADASVVETILLPNRREGALRTLVEQTLTPGKTPDPGGITNCLELGLLYLDSDRLADAEKLFTRMEAFKEPRTFRLVGMVGRGIVLALRSQAKESNRLLAEVFAPQPGMLGPFPKNKKGLNPPPALTKRLDLAAWGVRPLFEHPRGRHWLAQARWYNHKNGVPEDQVARLLIYRFPIEADMKK